MPVFCAIIEVFVESFAREELMKKYLVLVCALMLASGCASGMKKSFTVIADPPDSDIKVVSGSDLDVEKYRSPAKISVRIPKDSRLLVKNVVEISKAAYKTQKIQLRDIKDGEVLNIKLDKVVAYRLKYRLISPVQSDEVKFRDKIISLSFVVGDQSFQMNLENLTAYPLKIMWDRAEYTDVNNRAHQLMHSGIRYQDRSNPIPAQTVPAQGTVQQTVMPISSVVYSQEKKAYENFPLFPLDSDMAAGLKGRVFYLFIPVEIDRQIIPYNFKIQITEAVK
jgi:hypothetical protein